MSDAAHRRRLGPFDGLTGTALLQKVFSIFDGPVVVSYPPEVGDPAIRVVVKEVERPVEEKGVDLMARARRAYIAAVVRRWLKGRGGLNR